MESKPMNESVMRKLSVSTSFAVLMSAPVMTMAAYTAGNATIHDVQVQFSDLDLRSEAGIKTLYSRLQAASRRVCDTSSALKSHSTLEMRFARSCYTEALARAVSDIDNEKLSRLHES
jgi:UrcA family protein